MANKTAITGTIRPELREAVEDYRWSHRMSVSDVVGQALEVWAEAKGVKVPEPAAEPAQDDSKAAKTTKK